MRTAITTMLLNLRSFVSSHVCAKLLKVSLDKCIISFTFDDVPAATFDHVVSILDKYDCKATFYISGQLCSDNPKYLNRGQIQTLLTNGHEIACHTFSHVETGLCTPGALRRDLDQNREYFHRNFLNYTPSNFSYPCGSIGLWNKPKLNRLFESCRTTCPGINYGRIDMSTLLAYKLYSSTMKPSDIDRLIALAKSKRGWLIFYTHDVCPNPSAIGCTARLLEYAVRSAAGSSAKVLNIKQAVREICQSPCG